MAARRPSPAAILSVMSFGVFVAADDLTVVATMLRQIIFDLEIPLPAGLDQAAWIVNAYLIAYVAVMPFIGRLSDIFGRRAIYLSALALFIAGSVWVPFSSSLDSFLFGRVLTAIGGGAMVPVAMAVIGDVYQSDKRATAMGVLGAIDTAGWVWGPFYGALLINFLNWRWQFYLNIPLGIVGMAAGWWALGDLPGPRLRTRVDWLGASLLTICLITLNIALLGSGDIQSAGDFAALDNGGGIDTLPYYITSAISLILFVLSQRYFGTQPQSDGAPLKASHSFKRTFQGVEPLIDLGLFRRSNFTPAILVNFLVGGVIIIAMVNVPLLVNVLELDIETAALSSGYLLSGMTVSMAIMAYAGGRLTERFRYRPVIVSGLLLCAAGFGLMGMVWEVTTPYATMAWHLALLGTGFGLVIAPVGTAVVNAAAETQRGVAASLVIVFRLIGMSVGLSALTSWGLHRFGVLRTQITLPDLPFSDPIYQQAIVEGLMEVTVRVLTQTFLISAVVAVAALTIGLRFRFSE